MNKKRKNNDLVRYIGDQMAKTLLIIEKNPAGSIGLKKAKERGLNVILFSSNKYKNKPTIEDRSILIP